MYTPPFCFTPPFARTPATPTTAAHSTASTPIRELRFEDQACDDCLVVSGSSAQTKKMGVYAKTGVTQSGRPVYKNSDWGERAYLFFCKPKDCWIIGSDYLSDRGVIKSAGIGRDAFSPMNVHTWQHYDGSSFTVADGVTVVAQALAGGSPWERSQWREISWHAEDQACNDYLLVSGSSAQANKMGVYAKTVHRRSGRPVYRKDDTTYLFFNGPMDCWIIGSDYRGDRGVVVSTGSGRDAFSPVSVPTWKHYDGSSFTVAYGITVVAQFAAGRRPTTSAVLLDGQAVDVLSQSSGGWLRAWVVSTNSQGITVEYWGSQGLCQKYVPHSLAPGRIRAA